jgi:hypothetical protein
VGPLTRLLAAAACLLAFLLLAIINSRQYQ